MFEAYFQLLLNRGDGMQVENHLLRVNNGICCHFEYADNTIYPMANRINGIISNIQNDSR